MESDQSNKRQRLGPLGGESEARNSGSLRRDEADFDVGASWRALVLRLGERSAEFAGKVEAEEQIELTASVLTRNWDGIKGDLLPLLMQCMEELPSKAPFYATLVGLLNTSQQLLGRAVVDHVFSGLQAGLETGECHKVRLLLRILTLLMCNNVVTPAAVLAAYTELLSAALATPLLVGQEGVADAAMAENGASPPAQLRSPAVSPNQPRADFLVFCVLAALPFGAPQLHKSCGAELEQVLSAAEDYMSTRTPLRLPALVALAAASEPAAPEDPGYVPPASGPLLPRLSALNALQGLPQDYLEDLWARVTVLRKDAWVASAVPRPQEAFVAQLFPAEGEQQQHAGTPLTVPSSSFLPANPEDPVACGRAFFSALEAFPPRITLFRLFPAAKTDDILSPMDRFLVQEYIVDILFYLNGCRKECTAYLVQLPVPFRYEYVMAETIFSQLLLLPRPPFPLVAYTLILVDLCKALPAAFPAVLASAVRLLFSRMPLMDVECRSRVVQWMAHHLSNFAFVWPWDAWAAVARQPEWSPQRVFAAEVLEKEVRLAYFQKVKKSIQSEAMEELLPGATGPVFAYGEARRLGKKESSTAEKGSEGQGEQAPAEAGGRAAGPSEAAKDAAGVDPGRANGAVASGEGKEGAGEAASEQERQVAQQLTQLVRKKTPAREVAAWVDSLLLDPSAVPRDKAVDIVVQTLLMLGSKSITHSSTLLERYSPALQKLAPSQALQVAVVASVVRLWRDSPQMAAILVDRCMALRIVSNLAIVDWVFTQDNLPLFHSSDRVWEILRSAIAKTAHRVQDLVRDVEALRRSAAEADASARRSRAEAQELEEAAAALSSDAAAQLATKVALAQEHAARAEAECTAAQEAAEAKEALLSRAQREQEVLFSATLSHFSEAVGARLGAAGAEDKEMEEGMGHDEGQGEEERPARRKKTKLEEVEEKEWLRCTLGTLRSICRHYASQVWQMMDSLNTTLLPSLRPDVVQCIEEGLLVPTTR